MAHKFLNFLGENASQDDIYRSLGKLATKVKIDYNVFRMKKLPNEIRKNFKDIHSLVLVNVFYHKKGGVEDLSIFRKKWIVNVNIELEQVEYISEEGQIITNNALLIGQGGSSGQEEVVADGDYNIQMRPLYGNSKDYIANMYDDNLLNKHPTLSVVSVMSWDSINKNVDEHSGWFWHVIVPVSPNKDGDYFLPEKFKENTIKNKRKIKEKEENE